MHEQNFSPIIPYVFTADLIFRTFSKIAWNITLEPEALEERFISMPHLFVNEKHIRNVSMVLRKKGWLKMGRKLAVAQ